MTNQKLSLINFGPVEEAFIDIKPLTIIKGPNNTGKTMILKLINSLNSVINNQHPELNSSKLSFTATTILKNTINQEFFDDFQKRFNEYIDTNPNIDGEPFRIPFEEFDILYRDGIQSLANICLSQKLENTYHARINDLIKADKVEIIENGMEDFKFAYRNISYENTQIENFPYINIDLESGNEAILSIHFNDKVEVRMNSGYIDSLNGRDYEFYFLFLYSNFAKAVLNKIFETSNSYILERLNEDFVKFILDNNIKSPLNEIGLNLEKDILDSRLINENDGLYYKSESDLISVDLASDSLKKLSNIIFHIKHVINAGDYLIIDDIEDHLDKKSIGILARYLSQISERDVNVVLSTHSDYVVEEFEKHSKDLNAYCL